ncbi:MAG: outer membrane beta-barrel protein [Niabella sp.]|nr:outer membrane beta-barrel protein [Niabella sp.]
MKKIVLSLFSLAVIAGANAQSGTVLVGGNVGVHTKNYVGTGNTTADGKTTQFEIAPTVGYQFNDNWTLGVTGGVGLSKTEPKGSNTVSKTSDFNVGPFVRYTAPVSDIFAIYGQLQGGYQGYTDKTETTVGGATTTVKSTGNGGYARLFPAVFINVKNNFGLNVDFGGVEFNSLKAKGANKAANTFDFTFGRTFNIGISKNF